MSDDFTQRKAAVEAAKAEIELAEFNSPSARRQREAERQRAIAEAEQHAIAALVPDLSKVTASTLDTTGATHPLAGPGLTFGAIGAVVEDVVSKVVLPAHVTGILVTSDPDLVSASVVHAEASSGLKALTEAADTMLAQTMPPKVTAPSIETRMATGAIALGSALATVTPHVLSLLSAQRTVTTGATAPGDLAISAAVAGALAGTLPDDVPVLHDSFRTVTDGPTLVALEAMNERRRLLAERRLALNKPAAKTRVNDLLDQIAAKLDAGKEKADVEEAGQESAKPDPELAAKLDAIDALAAQIDAFAIALRTIPAGATHSPLATAMLHDVIASGEISHALLVKAEPGGWTRLESKKPLWFADRFSMAVEANVTYLLIETASSRVIDGGTATATLSAKGEIGDEITFL